MRRTKVALIVDLIWVAAIAVAAFGFWLGGVSWVSGSLALILMAVAFSGSLAAAERIELGFGDVAAHRRHAAIRARDDALLGQVFQRLREDGEDPYFMHFYRAKLDGSGMKLLDPGDASHAVAMSPSSARRSTGPSFGATCP